MEGLVRAIRYVLPTEIKEQNGQSCRWRGCARGKRAYGTKERCGHCSRKRIQPLTGFWGGRQADRWQDIRMRAKMDSKRTGVRGGGARSDSEAHSLPAAPLPLGPRGPAPAPGPRPSQSGPRPVCNAG